MRIRSWERMKGMGLGGEREVEKNPTRERERVLWVR